MCILIIKKEDVKNPDKKILQNCFENNDDGAGYAIYSNNQYHIRKGFMTFNTFYESYIANVKDSDFAIIHFRIGTSGVINPGCTHPFPITSNIEELLCADIVCNSLAAHNGILGAGSDKLSDTMLFVKDVLADSEIHDHLNNKAIRLLIGEYIGSSKLVICKGKDYWQYGDFIEDKGLLYSNNTYLYSYGAFDDTWYNRVFTSKYKTKGISQDSNVVECPVCYSQVAGLQEDGNYLCEDCLSYFDKTGTVIYNSYKDIDDYDCGGPVED